MTIQLIVLCILTILSYGTNIYLIIKPDIELHYGITDNRHCMLSPSTKYLLFWISVIAVFYDVTILTTLF